MENIHIILIIFLLILMFKKSKSKENFSEITADEEEEIIGLIESLPKDDEQLKKLYWKNTTQKIGRPCKKDSCGKQAGDCPTGYECRYEGRLMCVPGFKTRIFGCP